MADLVYLTKPLLVSANLAARNAGWKHRPPGELAILPERRRFPVLKTDRLQTFERVLHRCTIQWDELPGRTWEIDLTAERFDALPRYDVQLPPERVAVMDGRRQHDPDPDYTLPGKPTTGEAP